MVTIQEFLRFNSYANSPSDFTLKLIRIISAYLVIIILIMNEKDIFDEKQELKRASFSCPFCRERNDYEVRWMTRIKKKNAPRHLAEHDRMRFEKSRDYMVRIDDMLMCKNMRCRRRFEIPSAQSVVFI